LRFAENLILMHAKKVIVAVFLSVMFVSCKPKMSSNIVTYSVPEKAVRCVAGNYIIRSMGANQWKIFRIEKVALISELSPFVADASSFIEDVKYRPGNTVPEGYGEIHLIVSSFNEEYSTEQLALEAFKSNKLGDGVGGLCRKATYFLKVNSKVYKSTP
jgi:hypothetical protein